MAYLTLWAPTGLTNKQSTPRKTTMAPTRKAAGISTSAPKQPLLWIHLPEKQRSLGQITQGRLCSNSPLCEGQLGNKQSFSYRYQGWICLNSSLPGWSVLSSRGLHFNIGEGFSLPPSSKPQPWWVCTWKYVFFLLSTQKVNVCNGDSQSPSQTHCQC